MSIKVVPGGLTGELVSFLGLPELNGDERVAVCRILAGYGRAVPRIPDDRHERMLEFRKSVAKALGLEDLNHDLSVELASALRALWADRAHLDAENRRSELPPFFSMLGIN